MRLTANNPSAFTFHGTNSYIVGTDTLAIIDPGPENEAHYRALLETVAGRPVSHIFVSHTHRDHSPLAQRLKEELGALTVAEGRTALPDPIMQVKSTCSKQARIWISCPISCLPTGQPSMATAGRSKAFTHRAIPPTIWLLR